MGPPEVSEDRLREIEASVGPLLSIDKSHEWLSRLEEETKGDQCLPQYLKWMRTKKPKQQIRHQLPQDWLDQVARADFSDPLIAINFRSTLFSKEIDYLELAVDANLAGLYVVISDPGALRIYGNPFVKLTKALTAEDGLQMHPALLSLSLLDDHTPNRKVQIPELVLPVGRLLHVDNEAHLRGQAFYEHKNYKRTGFPREEDWPLSLIHLVLGDSEFRLPAYCDHDREEFRRKAWERAKESDSMKDTDYFVVIDVVTPGHPVWIIYNPNREEDSEDLTVTDLLQSTSRFPGLESKSGFGAAQIWTGIDQWLESKFWESFHSVSANISRSNISYPVVGRLENLESAKQMFSKRRVADLQ